MTLPDSRTLRRIAALLATASLVVSAFAADRTTGEATRIVVADAWARPTAAGMPMGVAYFTIVNGANADDALFAASTPAAARVEMHETRLDDGMARMRPLAEIRVPARSRVAVAPGGIHLMLVDLAKPLVAGTQVPLTLEFRKTGRVTIQLRVETRGE